MPEPRKLRVFLCHASQDKPIVRELYQQLLAEGWIDPWLDKEKLLPGQDWELEIEKSVKTADVVIVCLSKESVEKEGYYQKEIRKVLDVADEKPEGTIFIIPLRLNNCQIPHRLAKWQYEDYFPIEQREKAYKRLLQSLRTRFNQLISRDDESQQNSSELNSILDWDEIWFDKHRSNALKGMERNEFTGYVEVKFSLVNQKPKSSQKELLVAARNSQIHTFGWPIGIVLDTLDYAPKPLSDGIKSEIETNDDLASSYDYWVLRNNGDFYLMKSLFEDGEKRWEKNTILAFNTRIQRTTEILLYCKHLFEELGVDSSTVVKISIKHGGLENRRLSATRNRLLSRRDNVCIESETEKTIQVTLSSIDSNLVKLVKEFTQPLFLLFDFQEFADSIYEDIAINYAKGKIV
jgi:hypothetical protein